jgi:hypothetical protein
MDKDNQGASQATGPGCYDCGFPYDDPAWIEAVVPHFIWNDYLSPTGDEGGILCIQCIARRAIASGFERVPVLLTAGPLRNAEPYEVRRIEQGITQKEPQP